MSTRTDDYEIRESRTFHAQMAEFKTSPDRQENGEEFLSDLQESPDMVAERAGWAINGNYGYGAMQYLKDCFEHGTPLNKRTCLFYTVAGVEWRTSPYYAGKAWKALTKTQRNHIDKMFDALIKEAGDPR